MAIERRPHSRVKMTVCPFCGYDFEANHKAVGFARVQHLRKCEKAPRGRRDE